MTTINDISDLAEVLRKNPQWLAVIRGIVLTDELLETPGRVAALVSAATITNERLDRLEAGQARLETDVSELKDGQARLETGQARLETDVSELKDGQARLETGQKRLEEGQTTLESRLGNIAGTDYERQVARSARWRFRRHMDVRGAEVMYARSVRHREEIPALIENAAVEGAIEPHEADSLSDTDLVLKGKNPDGDDVYVVCEIGMTVYNGDVTRARDRAAILEKASGVTALPAVAGRTAPEGTLALAGQLGVPFIQVPAEPTENNPAP